MCSGIAFCANCGARLYQTGRLDSTGRFSGGYGCTGRYAASPAQLHASPPPASGVAALDAQVGEWFLARYRAGDVMRKVYDPGTGHAAQIAELEAARKRLREDRNAGLYDSQDDAQWYRAEYTRLGEEVAALRALPERKPGIRTVPVSRTIAQERETADNARRREVLAQFEVRVVLHPLGRSPRVAITGMELSPELAG